MLFWNVTTGNCHSSIHSRMWQLRRGGYPRLRPPVEKAVLGRYLCPTEEVVPSMSAPTYKRPPKKMQILYYADKDFTDNSEPDKVLWAKNLWWLVVSLFIYFFQINYFIDFFCILMNENIFIDVSYETDVQVYVRSLQRISLQISFILLSSPPPPPPLPSLPMHNVILWIPFGHR